MAPLTITVGDLRLVDCSCAIVVPEKAVDEHGYIKTFTAGMGGQGKHEFQALAQTAYYQFQDDELDIVCIESPVHLEQGDEAEILVAGMVVFRDGAGHIKGVFHAGQRVKKLLEAAHRYCTRWVRLDI